MRPISHTDERFQKYNVVLWSGVHLFQSLRMGSLDINYSPGSTLKPGSKEVEKKSKEVEESKRSDQALPWKPKVAHSS